METEFLQMDAPQPAFLNRDSLAQENLQFVCLHVAMEELLEQKHVMTLILKILMDAQALVGLNQIMFVQTLQVFVRFRVSVGMARERVH